MKKLIIVFVALSFGIVAKSDVLEEVLPFEEALKLAEKGLGQGYFQLALHYAKGQSVTEDSQTAWAFLKKAVEKSYPTAIFAKTLAEESILSDKGYDRDPNTSCYEYRPNMQRYFAAKFFPDSYGPGSIVRPWWRSGDDNRCITNETIVAELIAGYELSAKLGVAVATNEIARLNKRMDVVRASIRRTREREASLERNDEAATKLLGEEMSAGSNRKLEYDLYSDWPTHLKDWSPVYAEASQKFNCEFNHDPKRQWTNGCGRPLIVWGQDGIFKFDDRGVLVNYSSSVVGCTNVCTEIQWVKARAAELLKKEQENWATAHGMTLEEAVKGLPSRSSPHTGRRLLNLRNRPSNTQGEAMARLRERRSRQIREQRAAGELSAAERERAAAEREQQRAALLQIQAELRRQREAKEREWSNGSREKSTTGDIVKESGPQKAPARLREHRKEQLYKRDEDQAFQEELRRGREKQEYKWIFRVKGEGVEICRGISPSPTGCVTIPSELGGKPVTHIGEEAFEFCRELTSITIPNSVKSIGGKAFYYCHRLANLKISDGVTYIGEHAFWECHGLTSVTIPDSVTNIGYRAFCQCDGLKDITIGNGVKSIVGGAFQSCSNLMNVTIGNGVTNIGMYAFHNCSSLSSVTLPNSVKSVDGCAFANCRALTNVTIGTGVTCVKDWAFQGCSGLKSFIVSDRNPSYKSVSGLLLTKDGKTLVCGVNGDVIIPDSVTSIAVHAFSGCSGLTRVIISDSVIRIGNYAFADCNGLKSVTLPARFKSKIDTLFIRCPKTMTITYNDE